MTALPTPKSERWKYSNLRAYVAGEYSVEPLSVGYNGDEKFIQNADVAREPWAVDAYGDMALWEGAQDVFHMHIPKGACVDHAVSLSVEIEKNIKSEGAIHITLDAGATLTIFEDISVAGWCNRSMFITLGEGAELTHIRTGSGDGVVTNLTQVEQGAESKYNAYSMLSYAEFMRDQIHVRIAGENAKCYLSGAKILQGEQHSDTCILIEHAAPNPYSNQNYRNLIDGRARGVFQGKVHVHQIAQKTDGYQLCNSMLLSERAEMNTKPELEIYADDVKCSHGAVTAQADAEPLFYMMARGIPKAEAEAMLRQSFVAESLEAFEGDEKIYNALSERIQDAIT
ncbi:MAG: Fe-S cluster assembly protein SufD [Alphaproteobacteria bacterium]|nr:MAG: Fe-S cluster assembly protein SufD [Alphaproteobacteria bacterium]